ncbi:ATP-binding cassette domain-containing protein, partial [Enterococcus faecium]|nr:ATP-binding cassette domain-containing protein [Enterococcus faecium]
MCREVLKTKDLVKQIEGVLVLDKVNMSISQGDIYGFIGNNGAGKTT